MKTQKTPAKASTNSPLGDAQYLYLTKSQKGGNIVDNTKYKYIEIYPAGYTKPSNHNHENRQEVHKKLFYAAVKTERSWGAPVKSIRSLKRLMEQGNRILRCGSKL